MFQEEEEQEKTNATIADKKKFYMWIKYQNKKETKKNKRNETKQKEVKQTESKSEKSIY